MPSDRADIPGTDGRVGRWTAAEIKDYVTKTGHRVVASEWDAFPDAILKNGFRDDAVLATVVREPLDRLVSAHKFWGILNNPAKNAPDPVKWLRRMDANARRRTMAQAPRDITLDVARNNFATWKFAAATAPERFTDCGGDASCKRDALAAALSALERFHVAAPMTWQYAAGPLYAAGLDEARGGARRQHRDGPELRREGQAAPAGLRATPRGQRARLRRLALCAARVPRAAALSAALKI